MFTVGTLVVTASGLGRVARVGNLSRARGYWIGNTWGSTPPAFAQEWLVRAATIGETICPQARDVMQSHTCGLLHVRSTELAAIREHSASEWTGVA